MKPGNVKRRLSADVIFSLPNGGTIFQGPVPPEGVTLRRTGIDFLVLSAEEYQPPSTLFPGVEVVHAPLWDHDDLLTYDEVMIIYRAAAKSAFRVLSGKKVLITCQMGLNRSGIITAVTLYLLTGATPHEIVNTIRKRRSMALSNESFVAQLPMIIEVISSSSLI